MATLLETTTLDSELTSFFDNQLDYLATVSDDGQPQIGPKGSIRVLDNQHLIYVEFTLDHAYNNIQSNNQVAVTSFDNKNHVSYRINGIAYLHDHDEVSETELKQSGLDEHFPNAVVVIVDIKEIYKL